MTRKQAPKPTDAELEILRVLWRRGPATVRDVHAEFAAHAKRGGQREVGYTTVLKLLQIMAEKNLVTRDESQRSHVYAASAAQAVTEGQLIRDLVEKAFGGSAAALALRALSEKPASAEEIAAIKRLLDEMERSRK